MSAYRNNGRTSRFTEADATVPGNDRYPSRSRGRSRSRSRFAQSGDDNKLDETIRQLQQLVRNGHDGAAIDAGSGNSGGGGGPRGRSRRRSKSRARRNGPIAPAVTIRETRAPDKDKPAKDSGRNSKDPTGGGGPGKGGERIQRNNPGAGITSAVLRKLESQSKIQGRKIQRLRIGLRDVLSGPPSELSGRVDIVSVLSKLKGETNADGIHGIEIGPDGITDVVTWLAGLKRPTIEFIVHEVCCPLSVGQHFKYIAGVSRTDTTDTTSPDITSDRVERILREPGFYLKTDSKAAGTKRLMVHGTTSFTNGSTITYGVRRPTVKIRTKLYGDGDGGTNLGFVGTGTDKHIELSALTEGGVLPTYWWWMVREGFPDGTTNEQMNTFNNAKLEVKPNAGSSADTEVPAKVDKQAYNEAGKAIPKAPILRRVFDIVISYESTGEEPNNDDDLIWL